MTILNSENTQTSNATQDKIEVKEIIQEQPKVTNAEETKTTSSETQEDPNWREFREARKRDRAEKEAAEKRAKEKDQEIAALKAAMEAAFSKSAPSVSAYQQYYGISPTQDNGEESEEQRLEKKLDAILSARERKYVQEQEERERREFPQRLTNQFPDFSNVCSQENMDYLDYHYPEIARPLGRLQDGYDKWHDIYHAIKKLIPNHTSMKKDSIKADVNQMKPKSISSTQMTQSGQGPRESWKEAEARRAANWERMQRTLHSAS